MQLLQWLSVFAFGLLVSAEQQPLPKELDIKTTYKPSDCTVKAQKGDPIKVHYVRFLIYTFPSCVLMCVCVCDLNFFCLSHTDRNAILQWQQI